MWAGRPTTRTRHKGRERARDLDWGHGLLPIRNEFADSKATIAKWFASLL